jgi:hypothetical protein
MAQQLKDVLNNIKDIGMSESSLNTLMDYERVLDEMNLYAFKNWKMGELIEGPMVGKYRVSCKFMWPFGLMPDPAGAERLLIFGAKIKWGKDWLEYPVKVKSADDFQSGTKMPKMARKQIWTVEINLPKSLIKTVQMGSEDILNNELNLDEIDNAYDKGFDEQGINADQTQEQIQTDMAASAGEVQF